MRPRPATAGWLATKSPTRARTSDRSASGSTCTWLRVATRSTMSVGASSWDHRKSRAAAAVNGAPGGSSTSAARRWHVVAAEHRPELGHPRHPLVPQVPQQPEGPPRRAARGPPRRWPCRGPPSATSARPCTASTSASSTGSSSALPARTWARGTRSSSTARMWGSGSTATTSRPRATRSRVSAPVPAPRSSTWRRPARPAEQRRSGLLEQPRHAVRWVPGPDPVVGGGHRPERLGATGGQLVHGAQPYGGALQVPIPDPPDPDCRIRPTGVAGASPTRARLYGP